MRRRDFITLLGGAAATWPIAAQAQQPAMPLVGFLHQASPESNAFVAAAFRKGLSETGYIEGQNVSIEYRWAQNELDGLPKLAADLVRRRVAVIAAPGSVLAALAAKAATKTIPIVFTTGSDPVQTGLVASFNQPGGNLTGIASMNQELGVKRFGLLHELMPRTATFAVLVDPSNPVTKSVISELQDSAKSIGRQIEILAATTPREIDAAFVSAAQKRVGALLVSSPTLFLNRRVQIVGLAAYHRLPTMYAFRENVDIGGLMSYGSSAADRDRQAGIYVGRILKGEKPADMPVMRAVKFEFVINLQTARTLGIEMPPTLLAIADEVIE
jgi:putative tryptophan/tyrosine transport system substrate-binding protein